MSSKFRILCLSHDPAFEVGITFEAAEHAVGAVRSPAQYDSIARHGACDLLIGEYSYSLVEVCCTGRGCVRAHNQPQWLGVKWLRLLAAAFGVEDPAVQSAVEGVLSSPGCWTKRRVERLRDML